MINAVVRCYRGKGRLANMRTVKATGLWYKGNPIDVMRGVEDSQKFIRLFDPPELYADKMMVNEGEIEGFELIYERKVQR